MRQIDGTVVRRANSQAERQHSQDLEAAQRRAELAQAESAGVAQVTQRAILEAMTIHLVRSHAQTTDPDGAEAYAFLASLGIAQLAKVVQGM